MERCFDIIDSQTKTVLRSEPFLFISQETLMKIVKRDSLIGANEVDIFYACVRWAEKECERKYIEITPKNERNVLGEILSLIRFPTMTLDEYANNVTRTEILSTEESLSVYHHLTRKGACTDDEQPSFPVEKRASSKIHDNIPENVFQPSEKVCTDCKVLCNVTALGSSCPKCERFI